MTFPLRRAALALCWATQAGAAEPTPPAPPNAGSLLNHLSATSPALPTAASDAVAMPLPGKPTPPVPDAATATPNVPGVVLTNVRFKGNSVLSDATLAACAQDAIGRVVTLADLRALAAAMTDGYRAQGYLLAQVFVPPQDITRGEVEFDAVEGRVTAIRTQRADGTPLSDTRLARWLRNVPIGQPLRQQTLEATMLTLSDLPGLQVAGAIEPSRDLGQVNLLVSAQPARPWSFSLTGDNWGTPAAGTARATALARLNAPFAIGDNLDLTLLASQRLDTAYGRVAYDAPIDYRGTRAGLSVAHVNYSLGSPYTALDGFGDAQIVTANVSQPLLRSRAANVVLRAAVEYRRLRDNIGAFGLYGTKSLYQGSGTISYEGRDGLLGGGFSSANVTLTLARLNIDSALDRGVDQQPGGRDTLGNSARVNVAANRLTPLGKTSAFFLGVSGQWANRNLDSSSRLTLGGPQAVRAYSPSEAVVDAGAVVSAEVRYGFAPMATALAFFDYGAGRYNARAIATPGRSTIVRSGAGVGVNWSIVPKLSLTTTVAWRTTGSDLTGSDRVPRVYAQLTKVF